MLVAESKEIWIGKQHRLVCYFTEKIICIAVEFVS
jgi:hypothetical protein